MTALALSMNLEMMIVGELWTQLLLFLEHKTAFNLHKTFGNIHHRKPIVRVMLKRVDYCFHLKAMKILS